MQAKHCNQTPHPTDRDDLLKRLSIVDFMLLDLGLYLNSMPHCTHGLALHNKVSVDAAALRKQYEEKFGPLRMECENNGDDWQWTKSPWPWEAGANFKMD